MDAAAQYFREIEGDLTLEKVRKLKRGETLVYLRGAVVTKGRKAVPFLSRDVFKSPGYRLGSLADDAVPSTSNEDFSRPEAARPTIDFNQSFSQPAIPTFVSFVRFLKIILKTFRILSQVHPLLFLKQLPIQYQDQ